MASFQKLTFDHYILWGIDVLVGAYLSLVWNVAIFDLSMMWEV